MPFTLPEAFPATLHRFARSGPLESFLSENRQAFTRASEAGAPWGDAAAAADKADTPEV